MKADWPGRVAVLVMKDGACLSVGHGSGRETEIREGLAAGDPIVVYASDRVAPGVRIAPRGGR